MSPIGKRGVRDLIERDFNEDLKDLLKEIEAISKEISGKLRSIYEEHGYYFNDEAFKSVKGDIHVKVLGSYIRRVLNLEVDYEKKIVGKFRADILIGDKITIEVKSHGQFDSGKLKKRFERITQERPLMKHLYIVFKETEHLVKKTRDILDGCGVETFFLSSYLSQTKPERTYFPNDLQRFLTAIEDGLKDEH